MCRAKLQKKKKNTQKKSSGELYRKSPLSLWLITYLFKHEKKLLKAREKYQKIIPYKAYTGQGLVQVPKSKIGKNVIIQQKESSES